MECYGSIEKEKLLRVGGSQEGFAVGGDSEP